MEISVIIPTYKPGEYISDCLRSLEEQDFPVSDYEVIIVLNGCDMPYRSMLEDIVTDNGYVNVRLIQTDEPGVSNARNIGIDNAKGKYLLFIDDDDWVAGNDYLSSMHAMTDLHTVVACNCYLIDDKTREHLPYFLTSAYKRCMECPKLTLFNSRSFLSTVTGKLIPRDVIGDRRFDTKYKLGEDALFMFIVSDRISRMEIVHNADTVYNVRARENSATRARHRYSERIAVAMRLTCSYMGAYLKKPLKYDFLLFASRVYATISKLRKKVYE